MLNKIKCFFGFHEWEYSDQAKPKHGFTLEERMCDECGKKQKEALVTCFIPEIKAEHQPKRPVWINVTPDKPSYIEPPQPWSRPDKPTPQPEKLSRTPIDVLVEKRAKELLESTKDTAELARELEEKYGCKSGGEPHEHPYLSKLPQVNVDIPVPKMKPPKQLKQEPKEIDRNYRLLELAMMHVFVSTNESKTQKIAGKALNMKGF
jgi:hypothetical protein